MARISDCIAPGAILLTRSCFSVIAGIPADLSQRLAKIIAGKGAGKGEGGLARLGAESALASPVEIGGDGFSLMENPAWNLCRWVHLCGFCSDSKNHRILYRFWRILLVVGRRSSMRYPAQLLAPNGVEFFGRTAEAGLQHAVRKGRAELDANRQE
jgi:hypothetical protein